MTMEQFICMTDGFTKKRVLPEPLPPMTTIFLFLAYFGCFGLLSICLLYTSSCKIISSAEGVTEELKRTSQMEWVQRCNNIHNRAEGIVLHEMIYS